MATYTNYYMFQVNIDPYDDSDFKTLKDMLDNLPDAGDRIPLAKNGNKFDIYGDIRNRQSMYFGTFCLVQMNELPPRAKLGEAPIELDMDEDEGLGHYTSFVYDSTNNIILIQSNRNGITANGIALFFSRNFSVRSIVFDVVINPSDIQRLEAMSEIRNVEISIARVQNGSIFNNGRRRPISEMQQLGDATDANILKLTLGVGYDRSATLRKRSIISLVRDLLGFEQEGEVQKIIISGRETDESGIEMIDLITNKVIIKVILPAVRSISEISIQREINEVIRLYRDKKREVDNVYKVKSSQ